VKFICPICETESRISEEDLAHPVTKTTCRQCDTILLVNPDTGSVDAHKSPLKGTREFALSGDQTAEADVPVLEMRPAGQGSRDWTAIVIVAVVLAMLVSVGIYLTAHMDSLQQSFHSVSKLIEDLLRSTQVAI
jgi:hypothetical protein